MASDSPASISQEDSNEIERLDKEESAEPSESNSTFHSEKAGDSDGTSGDDAADGATEPQEDSEGSEEAGPSRAVETAPATSTSWQAIWSPQHNAYYFFNSETNETTWVNPLANQGSGQGQSSGFASTSSLYAAQAAAVAQGIDPALAHLDPTLVAGPSNPAGYTYAAKFNARTGAFTKPDARAPEHLSEHERAKRMSEFYFDVGSWEKEVADRDALEQEQGGKKRKKPTKKDLEMFKERKKQKKIAKTAWLRT